MQQFILMMFACLMALTLWAFALTLIRPLVPAHAQLGVFHLGAFYQSIDPAGALTAINAVQDQVITTSGVDLRVPLGLANMIGAAALLNDASASRAQVQSPSLRAIANVDIEPIVAAAVFGTPPEQSLHPESPVPLAPNESVNFAMLSDPAAAAAHYGLIWLADGPQAPVKGPMYTVRATAAAALAAGQWVNGNLSFSQTLPAGTYQIVGMRARGTNLVAARLVFVGGTFRPGVAAVNALADLDTYWQRFGNMGVFGQFDSTTPPTVDCLGVTDVAQTFDFDLIRVK